MEVGNLFSQLVGWSFYLFGKVLGPIIFIIIIILVAYFLDKKIVRPMWKDKWKKISISYNIDKYILRKKNLDVDVSQ